MKLTLRWFGNNDPIPLDHIRQIPNVEGIVSAIYDVPVGDVWPKEKISNLKSTIEEHGLTLEVIESVPIHEDIKLGLSSRDLYIENFKITIKNLSELGIHTVCYNFMPVFDWTRTDINKRMEDGSFTLEYDHSSIMKADPINDGIDLPGWATSYSAQELKDLLLKYRDMNEEELWDNLSYFLKEVVPFAEECGVKLAIHPDDPPWSVFGLPRIITNKRSLERLINIVDSPSNGLTLCTGSLGVSEENDVPEIIRYFGKRNRIHFLHFRNIKITGQLSFIETAHLSKTGSLNMYEALKAAVETGFEGPIRPDHGRMIWGEEGRPGYGLYDRALGCAYINGLLEAIERGED